MKTLDDWKNLLTAIRAFDDPQSIKFASEIAEFITEEESTSYPIRLKAYIFYNDKWEVKVYHYNYQGAVSELLNASVYSEFMRDLLDVIPEIEHLPSVGMIEQRRLE